ncbi:MAG: biosynthetic-type acetolactate synthase large subunit [Chloroflexi bacterium]|nr:biosynthetic-type acetolactate synthase large subunit [Chloroflexota bacterium]
MKKMKGAQILCSSLLKERVNVMFGVPGGTILPFYDCLMDYPQLRHILVRHEQGAAHAADGYARATGKVGVCVATSGPGATNLVTGIANAYLDSSPVVAITGQVRRSLIGRDGFQEADITGITLPITKHNYLVLSAADLARVVKEAFYIARTGRPGPVLIDVPTDVLTEEATFQYPDQVDLLSYRPTLYGHAGQVKKASHLIEKAKKPLLLAGNGIIVSEASSALKELAEKAQIPVVTTLLGLGAFPESHVLSYGMVGMHGMAYANLAVQNADLLIAVGMRFDDRATGRFSDFAPHAKIIHIDVDPAEIDKNIHADIPIVGDVKNVLEAINQRITPAFHGEWLTQLDEWHRQHPLPSTQHRDGLLPQLVVEKIYQVTGGESIIVTGVGQNQMWAAQYFRYDKPRCLISSGGLGTMGFELPAGMGAKVGRPQDTVWVVAGDGGFQMTIQELATIVQENIALKIAIINNGYLGMVRQWQQLFYKRRYMATPITGPDYVKLAEAYGLLGLRVTERSQILPTLEQAMAHPGPALIDFQVEREENVYPMVAPGASLEKMIFMKEEERLPT